MFNSSGKVRSIDQKIVVQYDERSMNISRLLALLKLEATEDIVENTESVWLKILLTKVQKQNMLNE